VRLPQPVRVAQAHLQDAAVAVDVLDGEALDFLLVVGIRPRARAHELRAVGERPFGAVWIDPRTQVERAGVEGARDFGVAAVAGEQRVQEIEGRRRPGDFGRVDVAVDPEGRLFSGRAGRGVGHDRHQDVAALVARADRFKGDELGVLGAAGLENRGQLGVAVEAIEGDGGHSV
jgi:hypothetical protein